MQSLVLFNQKLKTQSDTDLNDSDKTFTVPTGKRWIINTIWVELTTTATVGNRQVVVQAQSSGGDVLVHQRAGALQAASLVRHYLFATGVPDATSFRSDESAASATMLTTPLPAPMEMDAGEVLRVLDYSATAAAADDMVVHLRYYEQQDI